MTVTDNGVEAASGCARPADAPYPRHRKTQPIDAISKLHRAAVFPRLYNCALMPNYMREPRRNAGRP